MNAPDVLAVMDRYVETILPMKLWDGSNPYCGRPGCEGSDYSDDRKALYEARAAVAEVYAQRDAMAEALRLYAKAGVGNSTDFYTQSQAANAARAALANAGNGKEVES